MLQHGPGTIPACCSFFLLFWDQGRVIFQLSGLYCIAGSLGTTVPGAQYGLKRSSKQKTCLKKEKNKSYRDPSQIGLSGLVPEELPTFFRGVDIR